MGGSVQKLDDVQRSTIDPGYLQPGKGKVDMTTNPNSTLMSLPSAKEVKVGGALSEIDKLVFRTQGKMHSTKRPMNARLVL